MVRACIVNCTHTVKIMDKQEFRYNGWANYETWLVSVWDYIPVFSEELYERGVSPDEVRADDIQEMFEEYESSNIPRNGIISDMVRSSIQEIDFFEIAEHVTEELQQRINDEY